MKKVFLLFLLALALIPAAFADIALTTDQTSYNLGNKIKASATVEQSSEFEGFFRMTLSCGAYKMQYFMTPVTLEANFATALNVPELPATASMMGDCAITGELATNDNSIVEQKKSALFKVIDQLSIANFKDKITALPGENIDVTGFVKESFGNYELKASAKITLDDETYEAEVKDGKFTLPISLKKDIKSGMHTIEISILDAKNNLGSSSVELEVTAVPTSIKSELSGSQFLPGAKMEITPILLDQAGDVINVTLSLEFSDADENKVFTKEIQSNQKIEYELSQYAKPGEYTLTTFYKNLKDTSKINISVVREIKVNYDNELVKVENTGNIPFEDELTFIIQNELNKYPITKKLNIDPGKILDIDLSKEVPLGDYNILFPSNSTPVKDALQEVLDVAKGTGGNVLASDVMIHDNRPLYKKVGSGFSSLTGNLVGTDGILTKNPFIAPIILFGIVGLLVFKYGRKPIMKLIKREKSEEKKD